MAQTKVINDNGLGENGNIIRKISAILELIKFSHTIFSIPFVIMSAFIAASGLPSTRQIVIIIFAVIMARSCAMAFNRLVDAKYDEHNDRTKYRVSYQRFIGKTFLWIFAIVCALLFVFASWMLNNLSLMLAPIVLLVLLGYSFTKRFTNASHFVLGASLGLAPIGAWVGITGECPLPPFILGLAVLFWTAGFDVIYSCQDFDHDKAMGLFSIPKRFGIKTALKISWVLHLLTIVLLFLLIPYTDLGFIYVAGVCGVAGLLLYEHTLVKPDDLSKINIAFFNVNGMISIGLMIVTVIDIFVLW
ncbi:MAG: UbiA-like polyprenyltransferase [Candidatus Anammoxibacter sp.]